MEDVRRRFFKGLRTRPVIAGLRESAQVESAIRHGVGVVFILGEDIFALQESVAKTCAEGRLIFAHVDLIKGVGREEAGVRFLAKHVGVDGILTTRSNLVSAARREGLVAVQRLFVLDSESLTAGLPTVEKAAPDAVEVLAGVILPAMAQELATRGALPPLIAGGLIRTTAQARWRYHKAVESVEIPQRGRASPRMRAKDTMSAQFKSIHGQGFDVVVIGGGMADAGVARDAALRGYRTLLLERKDFAFGTTSRSSKLIHGGLRYLELFDFGLVRESLRERERLQRLAPHLVRPLPFVIPVYRGAKRLKRGRCCLC